LLRVPLAMRKRKMQKSKKLEGNYFYKGDNKMAFSSIIEDTRRMNAKMISMGQSIDIQKMPRPKAGTITTQKQAMYTPSGSEIEKMLYPKNFRARVYEEIPKKEETIILTTKQEVQLVNIIRDDAIVIEPSFEIEKKENNSNLMPWQTCKYYKQQGGKEFCKEFLCLCGKGKCSRIKK